MSSGLRESSQLVMDNLHSGAVILLCAVFRDNTEALDDLVKS